jgi:hypothetical protein
MSADPLKALFLACWVAALILVSGVLGDHKNIVFALAAIGITIAVVRHRKPNH